MLVPIPTITTSGCQDNSLYSTASSRGKAEKWAKKLTHAAFAFTYEPRHVISNNVAF